MQITDRHEIRAYLNEDRIRHLFSLGDLDDHFFPFTKWYGIRQNGSLKALVLLFEAYELPVLLAFGRTDGYMDELLLKIIPILPDKVHCHLESGLGIHFKQEFTQLSFEPEVRMTLSGIDQISAPMPNDTCVLTRNDSVDIQSLLSTAYPANWFQPSMLDLGHFTGIYCDDNLAGVCGLHIYSEYEKIAVLGNIATHPAHRKKGIGKRAVTAACYSLLNSIDLIGLNVHAENTAAINTYESVGFKRAFQFEVMILQRR